MNAWIEVIEYSDEVRVYIRGQLDRQALALFQESLSDLPITGRSLVLDISEMASLDSCGLGMLLVAREIVRAEAATIRGASGEIRRALELVNFGELFKIE